MSEQTVPIAVGVTREDGEARAAAQFIHPANLLTYLSFSSGIAAIVAAHELGTPLLPAALLAIGVLADIFDGKFARLFSRRADLQAFGAQIDSLSDAIAFGAAPVVVFYLTGAAPSGAGVVLWWCAASFYLICALTRLGAYNLTSTFDEGFTGLPTPLAALILVTSMLATSSYAVRGVLLVACGAAMVSPLRIARPRLVGLGILVIWTIAIIVIGLSSIY